MMYNFYRVKWDFYLDGVLMDSTTINTIAKEAPDKIIELNTWTRLDQFYSKHSHILPFSLIFRGRSGGFIYWSNGEATSEKKRHDLNLMIKLTSELYNPTIKEAEQCEFGGEYIRERWDKVRVPN